MIYLILYVLFVGMYAYYSSEVDSLRKSNAELTDYIGRLHDKIVELEKQKRNEPYRN